VILKNLIKKNRSYRRFHQNIPVTKKQLKKYVELAMLSASAANMQPLKYILSASKEKNALIFRTLAWAGYIRGWDGPGEGERPSAYIIVLGDTAISKSFEYDCGIAAQSILLGAVEDGLGGCIIGSIKRGPLREALNIPDRYKIPVVLALGKPKEKIKIETAADKKTIKYWRDKNDVHHVPKRPLDEIIIEPTGDS
jgi:nitroreductase